MSRIFLSYAREDKTTVDDIYKSLKGAGLSPWMDDPPSPYELEGIQPGQDWDQIIRKRLKEATVTLAFLSTRSIAKEGYVQREYRLALNVMMEKPLGNVYLIPVLLEKCTPPDIKVDSVSLHQLNWYNLYDKGINHLINYLRQITQPGITQATDGDNSQNLEVIVLKNRIHRLEKEKEEVIRSKDELMWKLEAERDDWKRAFIEWSSETNK